MKRFAKLVVVAMLVALVPMIRVSKPALAIAPGGYAGPCVFGLPGQPARCPRPKPVPVPTGTYVVPASQGPQNTPRCPNGFGLLPIYQNRRIIGYICVRLIPHPLPTLIPQYRPRI
jgi:hypothetical protein